MNSKDTIEYLECFIGAPSDDPDAQNAIMKALNCIKSMEKDKKDIDEFARDLCKERMLEGKAISDFDTLQKYIKKRELEAVSKYAAKLIQKAERIYPGLCVVCTSYIDAAVKGKEVDL